MARMKYTEQQIEAIRSKVATLPDRPVARRLELDEMIAALRPEIEQRLKAGWAVREIAAEIEKMSEVGHRGDDSGRDFAPDRCRQAPHEEWRAAAGTE